MLLFVCSLCFDVVCLRIDVVFCLVRVLFVGCLFLCVDVLCLFVVVCCCCWWCSLLVDCAVVLVSGLLLVDWCCSLSVAVDVL